jgi:hypothetical protein
MPKNRCRVVPASAALRDFTHQTVSYPTRARCEVARMVDYNFGFGGGSSRAGHSDWNPCRACDPSQKGLFSE